MINAQEARERAANTSLDDVFTLEQGRVERSIKQSIDDKSFFAVIVIDDSVREEIILWLDHYGFSVMDNFSSCTIINWEG